MLGTSGSWRIGVGGGQAVHAVLYIRDACGLSPAGIDIPPPLAGPVENVDLGLSPSDQTEASDAWLEWWRRLVRVEGAAELGDTLGTSSKDEYRKARTPEHRSVFDPPGFESLASCVPLQQAARRTSQQALAWWDRNRRRGLQGEGVPTTFETLEHVSHRVRGVNDPADSGDGTLPSWTSYKAVAEAVIDEYQVSPNRVKAGVIILGVTGTWSCIPEPGVLLCSEEAFADNYLFTAELKKAFETGLNRTS